MEATLDYTREFPLSHELIYLNHAAVAPWPLRTAEAVNRFAEENVTRGAAGYERWLQTERAVKEQFCRLLNAPSPDDIALLKNTSEALSVVAHGLDWSTGDNVVSAREEFPSNRIVWQSLAPRGVELRTAELETSADPEEALIALMDGRTRMLAVSSVQYARGLRLDLERLGEVCRSRGILFCVDAIQSVGAHALDVRSAHIDYLMADAHKWMLGPEGVAVFYSRPEAREKLRLLQYGWHMVEHAGEFEREDWSAARSARRFECGSPNMLGIHALQASLGLLLEVGMDAVSRNVIKNVAYLIDKIQQSKNLELLTPATPGRYAGIVTFRRRDAAPAALHRRLMDQGVICAQRGGGMRFSPHFYTRREELDRALEHALQGGV